MSSPSNLRQKLVTTNEVLLTIENSFEKDAGAVKRFADEAAAAIKKLRNALKRQSVESVASMVQKGELLVSKTILSENFEPLETGQAEEILKITIGGVGDDCLKNAINFVEHLDVKLQSAAYAAIYNEMLYLHRLDDVEILLLEWKLRSLEVQVDPNITQKIKQSVDKLIKSLVEDISSVKFEIASSDSDFAFSKKVVACSLEAFERVVPLVVEQYFDTQSDPRVLVLYSQSLPYYSNWRHVIVATFAQLKKRQLLKSETAMLLWAHAKYIVTELKSPNPKPACKTIVTAIHGELSLEQHTYFEILKARFDKFEIGLTFANIWTALSIMDSFIPWYYSQEIHNVGKILSSGNFPFSFDFIGRVLMSLYTVMEKQQHLKTFHAFQLFNSVKKFVSSKDYPVTKDIEIVREKTPKCVNEILWAADRKFRIINKYYGEPLCIFLDQDTVFSWTPCTPHENQLWTVTVNDDSALVTFVHCDGTSQLGRKIEGASTVICGAKTGTDWMIKAVEEDSFKIFKSQGEYLTAELQENGDTRQVQLRSESESDMQLWQIEFHV